MKDFLEHFGLKKKPKPSVPTGPTVPTGPSDPIKALSLAEQHRNLKMKASSNRLSLKGTVDNRLKNALDAINRDDYASATNDLTAIGNDLETELQKRNAYEKERDAIGLLLDSVKAHAQKAHVATEIGEIEAKLLTAKQAADLGDYDDTSAPLLAARNLCQKAKGYETGFAGYIDKRSKANALVVTLKGRFANPDFWQQHVTLLSSADTDAAPPKRDYDAAIQAVEAIQSSLKPILQSRYVDNPAKTLTDLKAKIKDTPTQKVLEGDIQTIEKLQAQIKSEVDGGTWTPAIPMDGAKLTAMLSSANKVADRRIAFDAQRSITEGKIKSLGTHKSLLGQMFSMNQLVARADGLASRQSMRFEDGIAELKQLDANCDVLLKIAIDAEGYANERPPADEQYANFLVKNDKKLIHLETQIASIDSLLANAKSLTGSLDSGASIEIQESQDWGAARKLVAKAVQVISDAEKLVAKLGDTVNALAQAEQAVDLPKITSCVSELRKQIVTAKSEPYSDQAGKEFNLALESTDKASDLATANKFVEASASLKHASEMLIAAIIIQREHGTFVSSFDEVDNRRKLLEASKEPTPNKIRAKIDAIQTALDEAARQDKLHAWDLVSVALNQAAEAAKDAELHAKLRKEFDEKLDGIEQRRQGLTNKDLALDVGNVLTNARSEANAFRFDQADLMLKNADARVISQSVTNIANSNPDDPALILRAQEILKAPGGGVLIDALIQSLPNSPKSVKTMIKLAELRFGVQLKSDENFKFEALKKMWEMLAKVPEQSKDNPSMKKVERREPDKNGGFYQSSEDLVVMNGRPGRANQRFGANIANELPTDMSDEYKPTDDNAVDYFDFATLHEVGHAIDDRLGFMNSREGKDVFGGWRTYGGAVDPIAEAVAKKMNYNSKPEQVQYIKNLILDNEPVEPIPPEGEELAWAEGLQKVKDWHAIATNGQIWWRQAETDSIAIDGVVYHEAYKKKWVSYSANARQKGMTGYQFRAPGEWFAELYACFHIGKLKPGHPAAQWIKSLSL